MKTRRRVEDLEKHSCCEEVDEDTRQLLADLRASVPKCERRPLTPEEEAAAEQRFQEMIRRWEEQQ